MSMPDQLNQPHEVPPSAALAEMLRGYQRSQALYVAAKLGIADLLKDGPKSCEELAQATGTHARSLYRVLRYLASIGVFTEGRHAEFGLTPLAACLQTGVPGSRRALAIMHGEDHYRAWGEILYSVKTGEPAFNHIFGQGVFAYLAAHPEAAAVLNEGMTDVATHMAEAVVQAYDFSPYGTIVDVGGGYGTFLTALLRVNPRARGILFDQPHVVAGATKHIEASGLGGRCQTVAGDFFTAVPAGGDAYVLTRVLHDWDEPHSIAILQSCHRAVADQGMLLVIEHVIPPGNAPSPSKLADLTMLVFTGGCERTEAEYRALFAAAGFTLRQIIPTQSPFSVIEGVRP
jgi:O-methyltransferase domain/Dimerisation domain